MAKKKYHELFSGIICNEDQEKFRDAVMDDKNNFVLVDAVSGSGKTLIAVTCAKQLVANGHYNSCVFIVPTTSEQELGYRPGTTSDKISDYMVP